MRMRLHCLYSKKFAAIHGLGTLCLLLAVTATAQQGDIKRAPADEALRVRVQAKRVLGEADLAQMKFADAAAGMEQFKRNLIVIRRNASVQLTVEAIDTSGRVIDVTRHRATSYQSLAPSQLSVSSTGFVTAAPSEDAQPTLSGDVAVAVIYDDPRQPAWNKLFFNIIP